MTTWGPGAHRHDDPLHDTESDGVGGGPLRPDEHETYRTDQAAGDGSDDEPSASPGAEPRVWFVVGLGLFVLFIAILVWAVLMPLV